MSQCSDSLIAALDVGTSSIRCSVFDSQRRLVAFHQIEVDRITPHPSWVEQDPVEIIDKCLLCMKETVGRLAQLGISKERVRGLGLTNQRETTIVWDKVTGKPLYNAILWLDNRTSTLAEQLVSEKGRGTKYCLQDLCGLPIHPYFSALKLRWLMDNVAEVKAAIDSKRCVFGTVDTWVLWNLTKGAYKTDVTNASRTMLLNIHTLQWDDKLLEFFGVPREILPEVCSSSEVYGEIKVGELTGVPIAGILGDQQAALVGHECFEPGTVKNTYGTGCFLLANIGDEAKISTAGLLTTVGYQFGRDSKPKYALEGSIAVAGGVVNWLKNNLGIIKTSNEINTLAETVSDTGGCYFVPAFSGLFAPYWDSEARGVICGLTEYVTKAHIARAALESVAFQTCEILEAIEKDSGVKLKSLKVDGGMVQSSLLLQLQSDLAGIPVVKPEATEITSLGCAIAAAKAIGFLEFLATPETDRCHEFSPSLESVKRISKIQRWKEAVKRSMNWERLSETGSTNGSC